MADTKTAVPAAQIRTAIQIPEIPKPPASAQANSESRAKEAIKVIRRIYSAVLNATTYRRTMTSAYDNGRYAVFTLTRMREPEGKVNFYSETVNYDRQFEPIPGAARYEMVNNEGYWEWNDKPGSDGVVFFLTNPGEPINTVGTEKDIAARAQSQALDMSLNDYYVSEQNRNGKAVDVVTIFGINKARGVSFEYVIDHASGALESTVYASPGMSYKEKYEINVPLGNREFSIPDKASILPTRDATAAADFLAEKSAQ